jgi:hypothetical protein
MAKERSNRNFAFVPVTNPGERADAQTRRLIRSHPQLEHNRLYPRPSSHSKKIIALDIAPLLENSQTSVPPHVAHASNSGERASARQNGEDGRNQLIPTLVTALSAHRFDPFVSFDIGPGRRSHQLWDHGLFFIPSCKMVNVFNNHGVIIQPTTEHALNSVHSIPLVSSALSERLLQPPKCWLRQLGISCTTFALTTIEGKMRDIP